MKLGFHYHIPAKELDGSIYTSSFMGVFLDSLATQVIELVCFMHTPLPSEDFMMDYEIKCKNIRLVSLGLHTSVPSRLIRSWSTMRSIRLELSLLDVILIRCPTPLLASFSGIRIKKKVYLIVGDYEKSSRDLNQPLFRKKAIQLWASVNKWQQFKAIRHALVFVNNGLIYSELKHKVRNIQLIRTTTLRDSDFFQRENTCNSDVVNLLYVGRLDLSKGLMEMIFSINIIRSKGINVYLHIVGWEDKGSTDVTKLLWQQVETLDLVNRVIFHGKKRVGEELNYYYRLADIFLIGSKLNEGFPRTIWEAFANSVPVVASRVGSIPLFINDNKEALLIQPGNVDSMVQAILRLIDDSNLRYYLIKNAFRMVKEYTLEKQTEVLVKKINEYRLLNE